MKVAIRLTNYYPFIAVEPAEDTDEPQRVFDAKKILVDRYLAAQHLLRVREMQLLLDVEPELDQIISSPVTDKKRYARARQLKELLTRYREEVG